MALFIEDGKGSGYKVGVNDENRILSDCVTKTAEHHANGLGNAYHVLFAKSPTANDDCIFYLVNSHSSLDMVIEGIWLSVDAACDVYIQLADKGTRNSATTLTPVNCNSGSGNTADGTFEEGVDLDGGTATLTGGSIVEKYIFKAATATTHFNFEQDIIIPKNETLTIWCSSLSATVSGTAVFNYHSHD